MGHPPRPLRTLSPSQIKTWRTCPRKWAWQKIHGLRSPGSPSTELGTRVHEIAEAWLEHGTAPDLEEEFTYEHRGRKVIRYPGQIFAQGIHHNPEPKDPRLKIEAAARFESDGGPWYGRVDVHYVEEDGTIVVQDHKTTSSLRWAMTPESLREDPQALIYAAWARQEYKTNSVKLVWVYYETSGRKTRKVEALLDMEDPEIIASLEAIDEQAKLMWDVYNSGLKANDLTPVPTACSMYGGCAFEKECQLTPGQRLAGAFSTMSDSVDVDIKNILKQHRPAPAVPPPLPPKLPKVPPPLPPPPPLPVLPDPINPPEAPPVDAPVPVAPKESKLTKMTRKQLADWGQERGLLDSRSKLVVDQLRAFLMDPESPKLVLAELEERIKKLKALVGDQ